MRMMLRRMMMMPVEAQESDRSERSHPALVALGKSMSRQVLLALSRHLCRAVVIGSVMVASAQPVIDETSVSCGLL